MNTFNTSLHLRVIGLILSLVLMISALPFALISSNQWQETTQTENPEPIKEASDETVSEPEHAATLKIEEREAEHSEQNAQSGQPTPIVIPAQALPEEKMQEGEVSTFTTFRCWVPLVKWYCDNMLAEYGTSYRWTYITSEEYQFFEGFELYSALYRVTFLFKGQDCVKDVVILFGSVPNLQYEYYLIDGCVTDTGKFPLKENWDKVKSSRLFGEYAGEYPKQEYSEGMTELDIGALIGEGRRIYDTVAISNNVIAVYSVLVGYSNESIRYIYNEKIDFIDITKGKLIYDSFLLKDLDKKEYRTIGSDDFHRLSDNQIAFEFKVNKPDDTEYYEYYEIMINDNGKITGNLETGNTSKFHKDKFELKSESGRYYAFHKDEDLYLHDNTMNTDILVHDGIPYTDESITDYKYAVEEIFIGDVLYYTEIGYEWSNGIGIYNPETNETVFNDSGMYFDFYSSGYVYGATSVFNSDTYFGRFSVNDPLKTEILIKDGSEVERSQFILSPDKKRIAKISSPEDLYGNSNKWRKDESTVTIYDASTFEVVETYMLTSAANYFQYGILIGDYIYLLTVGDDNYAYVIKI